MIINPAVDGQSAPYRIGGIHRRVKINLIRKEEKMKTMYSIQKLAITNDPWDAHDEILSIYERKEDAEKELSVLHRYWKLKGEAQCYAPKIIEIEANPPISPKPEKFRVQFEMNEKNEAIFIYGLPTTNQEEEGLFVKEEKFKVTKSILKDDGYHKFSVKFHIDVVISIEDEDTREDLLKKAFDLVTKEGYQIIE
jgi:hypothetical protein